jgi:hypothetical protein
MSGARFTPEEFERLMALPESDPARRAAMRSPDFDAWRRMHDEFASPGDAPLSPAELADAEGELERRLAGTLATSGEPRHATGLPPREAPARRGLLEWLRGAGLRPALAAAALLAVSVLVVRVTTRAPQEAGVRDVPGAPAALTVSPPVRVASGIEFRWTPVAGADGYTLVLYGPDLREVMRREGLAEPRLVLAPGDLPPGLAPGDAIQVEVIALERGDPFATSPPLSTRLP